MDNGSYAQNPPLTTAQMEALQKLVKQFKELLKRYTETPIPKLAESTTNATPNAVPAPIATATTNAAAGNSTFGQPQGLHSDLVNSFQQGTTNSTTTHRVYNANNASYIPSKVSVTSSSAPKPVVAPLKSEFRESMNSTHQTQNNSSGTSLGMFPPPSVASLGLSWQCFHSLLFYGLSKAPGEGSVAFSMTDAGCFSKGAHLPLVVSKLCAGVVRESLLRFATDHATVSSTYLMAVQRQCRSNTVKQFLELQRREGSSQSPGLPMGSTNNINELHHYSTHYKHRRSISQRQSKTLAVEERRRRDVDERKRRKHNEFAKLVMDHRERFLSFHKDIRTECAKVAKNVKMFVENMASRREKDEAKMEIKRLQALKENNMEEYMNLVKETKNGRLQFLLNETDNYLNTINKMIQEQRDASGEGGEVSHDVKDNAFDDGGEKMTRKAKEYYRSTHRTVEEVVQPRMLKGGELKEYQMAGLQWLVSLYNNNLNGILADEMGLGKTIQTIALLSYLMEFKHNNGPFLVVVPLSTLSNWVNEFSRWAPGIVKVIYKGSPDQRRKIYKEDIESKMLNVLLTTYEYVMKDKNLLRKITWQYIIVDEGHRMKNAQSKFAQTLGTVYTSKHRVLLTGTPLQNNLPELWALLNFLLPSIFSSVDTFDQWFNKPFASFRSSTMVGTTGVEEDENNLTQEERMLIVHRLHELLRPFVLRRVKAQVLDQMPQRVEKVIKCPLSALQLRMYHSIVSKGLQSEGGLNNAIMQLKKVCNHPYLFLQDFYIDEDLIRAAGKFELLDRMLPKLKAAGHRVLLFSQMVEVMNILEHFFTLRGYLSLRLDGNTTSDERERRMHAFNDPASPYFLFLLSTRAGGLGLNLATADTVIIFDSDWNPMADAQAQGRAHRIGQRNEVRVYRLLTHSPVEERVLARATSKKQLTELVVEAGQFNSRASSSLEDNKELMENLLQEYSGGGYAGDDATRSNLSDFNSYLEDCDVPDNDALNEMLATYDGEYELFAQIDALNGSAPTGDMKARLLRAHEIPVWMTPEAWHPKFTSLMQDVQHYHREALHGGKGKKLGGKRTASVAFGDPFADEDFAQETVHGKGMRQRKEVQYSDGLTDHQFARLMERQQAGLEATDLHTKKDEAPHSDGKKRSHKRGVSSGSTMHPIVQELVKVITELQKVKRADGSQLYGLFLEKPSRSIFPDYYSIVETPISLKEVVQRLKKGEYTCIEDIELDFALMSDNARTYNTETSPVFELCESLRLEFYQRASKVLQQHQIESLTQLSGQGKQPFRPPPLPAGTGYDIFKGSKLFVGLLRKVDDYDEQVNLVSAPKAKKGRLSTDRPSGNGGRLSLKLSLSSKTNGSSNSSEDGAVDSASEEEGGSGLVFSLSTRK